VNLADGTGPGEVAQGDMLRDIENIQGSARDDTLTGDHGNNHIKGGAGNDRIYG